MLSNTSKMPGKSISRSAFLCDTGSKLAKIPGSVCYKCYARKGRYRMPNVVDKMDEREFFFHAIDFVPRMIAMLAKTRSPYFRWFDSGDVEDERMAHNILDVVEATPDKKHWIPTKEHKIWQAVLSQRSKPANVVIRFSAYMVDKAPPKKWQHSSMVINKAAPVGHECPAPKQGGKCGDCRACWSDDVQTVTYHEH